MPRQLIKAPGADRQKSLGWLATWWIETFVVQGPGDVQGEPIVHGDEFTGFIVDAYALDDDGRRLHDTAFFSRPKGCNKSGLAAELSLFEGLGPCRFDGWAKGGETFEFLGHTYTYSKGEPMGRPVKYPFVRIMATEENQTGNTFDMIFLNCDEGPLAELKAYGMRANRGKIDLPFGGEIVPSTAGSASKDGGKETFVIFDESHLYNTKELRNMYSTVTRNLNKRKKIAETWALETTTMYLPGEESIAEATYNYAQQIMESNRVLGEGEKRKVRVRRSRLLFDHRWGEIVDLNDEEALEIAIDDAYGEAMDWNSRQGIIDDLYDPRRTPEESRRYFLNALTEAHNAWVTPQHMAQVTAQGVGVDDIEKGELVSLGFDGALTRDATALIGCRISDGALFAIKISERPDGPEAENWVVDQVAFDAKVAWCFKQFKVVAFNADPPHWQDWLEKWEREFGEEHLKVKAAPGSFLKWWTKRDIQMALALERLHQAIALNTVKIDPHPVLVRHFLNARRWERRGGLVIGKDTKNSMKKMDAAMAATLAYEARANYLAKAPVEPPTFVPRRIR